MRRRLDLAASLVTRPPVLFLDEPTTGLDPTSRVRMWDVIRELVADGATLLLTTQYLDEADELADRIVVDRPRPRDRRPAPRPSSRRRSAAPGSRSRSPTPTRPRPAPWPPLVDRRGARQPRRTPPARAGRAAAPASPPTVVRALDEAGVTVDDVEVHQPSLDDVFFALTGHRRGEPTSSTRPPTIWRQSPHERHGIASTRPSGARSGESRPIRNLIAAHRPQPRAHRAASRCSSPT